jgi:tetratricopeptide (TPR) repeat protein
LDLATVLLFYPLLGGTRRTDGLPQVLADYRKGSALRTTVTLLRARPNLPPVEQPIADFLLATNFAELGLDSLAARNLAALVDSPALGAGAFLALARVREEAGEDEALAADAQRAPWARLDDESLGEAAVHVARACMRLGRYTEAREWLQSVPGESTSFAFSRVLLVQTEYALGRPAAALEVAEGAFDRTPRSRARRWLDDRTAVLVGDMLTEIGLYHDAIDVLAWPAPASPFHRRAERDRDLARMLEAASTGSAVTADPSSADVEREIAVAAGSESAIAERAAELRAAWPSPVIRAERRRWAARVAAEAFERARPFGWRRALEVAWRSFPPVALYELAKRRRTEAEPKDHRTVGDEARFFFAPRPDVSRLLVGLALVSDTPPGQTCADRAATAVATRVAGSCAPGGSPVTSEELASVAAGCDRTDATPVREALERALRDAIAAESSRRVLEIREQRLRVAEAIAAAEVERAGVFRSVSGDSR